MTLAEDIALEHIVWLRQGGHDWPEIARQAMQARTLAGLKNITVTTISDMEIAFAAAWSRSQVQRMAAE